MSSSTNKNNKGSPQTYSDMYALHERGESQSEPEQGQFLFRYRDALEFNIVGNTRTPNFVKHQINDVLFS